MSLNLNIEIGSYTGGGKTPTTVTIGWQPAAVIVCSTRTGGPTSGRAISFKFADMSTSQGMFCDADAGFEVDCITITSTGFTAEADDRVNDGSETFWYVAFKDDEAVDTFAYVGTTGTGTRTFTLNRQPSVVMIADSVSDVMYWKFPDGPNTLQFDTLVDINLYAITITSTGFTIPEDSNLNNVTNPYYVLCLYNLDDSTQHVENGTYEGDGSEGRSIENGYQPKFVMMHDDIYDDLRTKIDGMVSQNGGYLDTDYSYGDLNIEIDSLGINVGSTTNTSLTDYYYIMGAQ